MTTHTINAEVVLQAYVRCALWSSSVGYDYADANDMAPDVSLESAGFGLGNVAPDALESMRADVCDFLAGADAAALEYWATELGEDQIGHDFWLTRNRHGAGFWDRFGADPGATFGRVLTEDAHPYGESELYVDADDVVHVG